MDLSQNLGDQPLQAIFNSSAGRTGVEVEVELCSSSLRWLLLMRVVCKIVTNEKCMFCWSTADRVRWVSEDLQAAFQLQVF